MYIHYDSAVNTSAFSYRKCQTQNHSVVILLICKNILILIQCSPHRGENNFFDIWVFGLSYEIILQLLRSHGCMYMYLHQRDLPKADLAFKDSLLLAIVLSTLRNVELSCNLFFLS